MWEIGEVMFEVWWQLWWARSWERKTRARAGASRTFRWRSRLKSKRTMEKEPSAALVIACVGQLVDGLPMGGLIPASVKG